MQFSKVLLSLLLIGMFACDGNSPTFPTPPPIEPPPVVIHPRVDQPFVLEGHNPYVFFGAYAEGCQTDEEFRNNVLAMQVNGWDTPNICAETEFWDEGCGDYPRKRRDPERLKQTLDMLARIPGIQVTVIANCTLKRQVPLAEQFAWAEQVAEVAKEFKNVAIYTHNEFDNCAGRNDWGGSAKNCAGKNEVARHVHMFKAAGFSVVTADDSFTKDPQRTKGIPESQIYGFRLKNIGAYPASFHPDRERKNQPWDPSIEDLRKLARYNGQFILSETVAWMDYSGRCDGLRTCDPDRIDNYIAACAQVPECIFTLHGENQLKGELPTRIPLAR